MADSFCMRHNIKKGIEFPIYQQQKNNACVLLIGRKIYFGELRKNWNECTQKKGMIIYCPSAHTNYLWCKLFWYLLRYKKDFSHMWENQYIVELEIHVLKKLRFWTPRCRYTLVVLFWEMVQRGGLLEIYTSDGMTVKNGRIIDSTMCTELWLHIIHILKLYNNKDNPQKGEEV